MVNPEQFLNCVTHVCKFCIGESRRKERSLESPYDVRALLAFGKVGAPFMAKCPRKYAEGETSLLSMHWHDAFARSVDG
jgi:hypothetical protein